MRPGTETLTHKLQVLLSEGELTDSEGDSGNGGGGGRQLARTSGGRSNAALMRSRSQATLPPGSNGGGSDIDRCVQLPLPPEHWPSVCSELGIWVQNSTARHDQDWCRPLHGFISEPAAALADA